MKHFLIHYKRPDSGRIYHVEVTGETIMDAWKSAPERVQFLERGKAHRRYGITEIC